MRQRSTALAIKPNQGAIVPSTNLAQWERMALLRPATQCSSTAADGPTESKNGGCCSMLRSSNASGDRQTQQPLRMVVTDHPSADHTPIVDRGRQRGRWDTQSILNRGQPR